MMWCLESFGLLEASLLASYRKHFWAHHAIFVSHVREEDFVTNPKNVCVGGYQSISLYRVRRVFIREQECTRAAWMKRDLSAVHMSRPQPF